VDRPQLDDLAELVAQLAQVGVAPQPAVHVDGLPQLERRHVRVRVVEQPARLPGRANAGGRRPAVGVERQRGRHVAGDLDGPPDGGMPSAVTSVTFLPDRLVEPEAAELRSVTCGSSHESAIASRFIHSAAGP
jgi:hypothetical protein